MEMNRNDGFINGLMSSTRGTVVTYCFGYYCWKSLEKRVGIDRNCLSIRINSSSSPKPFRLLFLIRKRKFCLRNWHAKCINKNHNIIKEDTFYQSQGFEGLSSSSIVPIHG